jgi:hypothetical protein
MCGYYFKKGKIENARIAINYNANEEFCGYCGEPRENCKC